MIKTIQIELSSLRSQLTGMMEYWNMQNACPGIPYYQQFVEFPGHLIITMNRPGKHGKFVKRRKENTWHL